MSASSASTVGGEPRSSTCRTASITTGPRSSPPASEPTIPWPTASTSFATPAERWPATSTTSTPPSPSTGTAERAQTRRQLAVAVTQRRQAERDLADAEAVAEQAARRRWGRRDHQAITNADQQVDRQRQHLQQTVAAQSDLKERFSELVEHQHHRDHVLAETHPRRVELGGALSEIDGALDRTRPGRVQALTEARADHLIDLLGAPPDHPTNRALWQHLANVVETHLDQQLPAPTWETLRPHLREARELIAEQAAPTRRPSSPAQPSPDRLAAQQAIVLHRQTIQLNLHAQETPGGPTPDLGL